MTDKICMFILVVLTPKIQKSYLRILVLPPLKCHLSFFIRIPSRDIVVSLFHFKDIYEIVKLYFCSHLPFHPYYLCYLKLYPISL